MAARVLIGRFAIGRSSRGRGLSAQFHTKEAFFITPQLALLAVNYPGFLFFDRTSGGNFG